MDLDLRTLEVFCKVVELEGFSNAGRALNLAQASVSERIANLETTVGTRLLDRLGRRVVPTGAGELLYRGALELLQKKREVSLEMEEFLGLRRGSVTVGASTVPGNYILPPLIGRFRREYPEITLEVIVGDSDEIADKVLSGTVEVGFVGSVGRDRNLDHTEVWHDELVLVVPASHPWSADSPVKLEALCLESFIARESGSGTQQHLERQLESARPGGASCLKVACILGSSDAVKEGVKAGVGAAFISKRAVETEVGAGVLKTIEVEGFSVKRHFHMVTDARRSPTPLCRALVQFIHAGGLCD